MIQWICHVRCCVSYAYDDNKTTLHIILRQVILAALSFVCHDTQQQHTHTLTRQGGAKNIFIANGKMWLWLIWNIIALTTSCVISLLHPEIHTNSSSHTYHRRRLRWHCVCLCSSIRSTGKLSWNPIRCSLYHRQSTKRKQQSVVSTSTFVCHLPLPTGMEGCMAMDLCVRDDTEGGSTRINTESVNKLCNVSRWVWWCLFGFPSFSFCFVAVSIWRFTMEIAYANSNTCHLHRRRRRRRRHHIKMSFLCNVSGTVGNRLQTSDTYPKDAINEHTFYRL